jgi:predicted negative regulator of RcsB-dependent stress response
LSRPLTITHNILNRGFGLTSAKKLKKKEEQLPVDPEKSDELEKTDAFDEFLFHATNYIYKRRKLFITLGVVFIATLLGAYGIDRYIKHQNNLRNEGLFKIESTIRDTKSSEQERYEKAIPIINEFLAENADTKQAEIALFYRSSLYFQQKKYVEAEKDLRTVLEVLDNPSDMYVLASIYLSNILRDLGKTDEAVKILESAKSEIMTDVVMMEIAEIYIASDKKEDAKNTLESILKDYPDTLYQSRIQQLLATL